VHGDPGSGAHVARDDDLDGQRQPVPELVQPRAREVAGQRVVTDRERCRTNPATVRQIA
jgi:hypothetical protein